MPVTENFNSLASSGSSSTLPAGWSMSQTTYTAGDGGNSSQGIRSYGAAASGERALGSLGTSVNSFGAEFQNATGFAITDLDLSYVGEQWRRGNNTALDKLSFEYSLNATSVTDGAATWISVSALDFTSPNTIGGGSALNGNLAANQAAKSTTITGLTIANGAIFWIRWIDGPPASGSQNHGLAVDDFSLTPTVIPEPSTLPLVALGLLALARRRRGCRA